MEVQVDSQSISSNSANLFVNTSGLDRDPYNVTCENEMRSHLVKVLNVTFQLENVSQSTVAVQPLASSTNYTCCLEHDEQITRYCSDYFLTLSGSTAGLSNVVAGVIGGVVGVIVTLLLIAGITGIAIGIAILLRRKR